MIHGKESDLKLIKTIDDFLLSLYAPKNFDSHDPKNIVYQHENAFENLICSLEDNGTSNAAQLSTFSLYKRIEFYQDKFKKTSSNGKSINPG